ncbi:flagellin [Exiguobacterium sp. SH3S1]|uniref:flagellin N-terminal helical domain-containing protein n=1 Tax=Exiguobacterium sp. SH3S1 TaxID=2510955 RepID=UPI0010394704|nr:flagellin [Exiguobacterium sp. SH3S1]TCI64992.1 flagellin [Exiguobacterium sp. SH3S1]
MIINHNLNAMNAHRNMSFNTTQTGKAMEKLSSGLRINRAGDDAAGLAISEKMRGQIRGLDQASRNAQDGISLIQTAEGALNETHSILQRMRELSVQSASDTNVAADRSEIQKEINQLTSEINRIGNTTEFNTQKVINGDLKGNGGTGTNASATFDFGVIADDLTGVSTTLKIGNDNYTINFTDAADFDVAGIVGDAATKTITVNTGTTAPTAGQLADGLVAAFESMRGADPTLKLTEFTFANDTGKLEITANATGDFSGTNGKDSIEFVSGRSVTVSDVVEGANGTGGRAQVQIGANSGQAFVIEINDIRAESLGLSNSGAGTTANGVISIEGSTPTVGSIGAAFTSGNVVTDGTTGTSSQKALDISTHDNATKAVAVIDLAIKNVSAERSKLGAAQNRLEHTINNLGTSSENLQAAESRIRDVDMASEMMNFTKNNILNQAAQAMLAQSKSQPEAVLQLLR